MDVDRSRGDAPRLGVRDLCRRSPRARSKELRGKMGDRGSEPEAEGLGAAEVGLEVVGIGCAPGPGVVTPGDSSPAIADEDWFW